ncbi:MAG: hypothetical protein LBH09_08080, partial [Peptococcaceae bacterium]|nr:hypothetical protein [Peptococcaceae bacterium]
LLGKDRRFGDTVVVGHVGWYDYRYACGDLYSQEELASKKLSGSIWQDSLYVDFHKPDPEVCDDFNEEISERLKAVSSGKIILMTHMVSHPFFLVPSYRGSKWDFFNGFLGSPKLYELTRRPGVCAAVSGHVHYRRRFIENDVQYINACLSYESEWRLFPGTDYSVSRQINETMVTIEL